MPSHESGAYQKINGRLLLALLADRSGRGPSATVGAAVVFTGDLEPLRQRGFNAPSMVHHPIRDVNIAAGWIALDRVMDLAALDQVISIEAGSSMKPEMDESVPEIGARKLHAGIDFLPSLKGSGVVVGVIDSGFELRHRNFRNADGSTRVIALWDQSIGPFRAPEPGQPPRPPLQPGETSPLAPFNYGVEYSREWINGFLGEGPSLGPMRSVDKLNHGTPVLGIAAGNGLQPGCCHFAGHYVGVAPEADLILVKMQAGANFANPAPLQHAFEYIFDHPLVKGRPTVVNFSQGDNLGPHDGTSALELTIDAVVLRQLGRAVVKSAGNEASKKRHAEVPVSIQAPRTADLKLHVKPEEFSNRTIEASYPGNARLAVSVTAPLNPRVTRGPIAAGDGLGESVLNPGAPVDEQSSVTIASQLNVPSNGKNLITIALTSTAAALPHGEWVIHFENTGNADATVQVWLDNDGDDETHFRSHVTSARTITTPGTAQQVITVGAFHSKGEFLGSLLGDKRGKLEENSSHGPIDPVGNTPARTAPDVVAPGVGITAPKNGEHETSCCECCLTAYKGAKEDKRSASKASTGTSQKTTEPSKENTGTSIAAPHVAGVVALMLQRHPQLTVAKIREILRDTADRPSGFTGPRTDEELNTFGFGRVNAVEALKHVPPFFGPPPPVPFRRGGAPSRAPLAGRGSLSPAPEGPCLAVAGFTPFRETLTLLRTHVLSSAEGQLCATLVSRNFSEARSLIRRNRRVAVAWHRAGGPMFLRTLMRALATAPGGAAFAIPDDLPDGFARFFSALARYGSANLRSDLARHGDEFSSLMRDALHRLRVVKPAA